MSLIEFKDYPSTETPLNAENLNYNFNEVNTKNIITVGLSGNITETTNKPFVIVFDKVMASSGTKLTNDIENGGVRIGAGVSKVKVSGQIIQQVSVAELYGAYIGKNETNLSNAVNIAFNYISATYKMWQTSLQPVVVDVKEGDIIKFTSYVQQNCEMIISAYDGRAVNMTVEVVE